MMALVRRATRRHPRIQPAHAGFTLIEVLVAVLIAMVGLLGTVAVQQTMVTATASANNAQVAVQLAAQTMEQLGARTTQASPFVDMLGELANGNWSDAVYLDRMGRPADQASETNRWRLRTRVSDQGPARPYNLTVEVAYTIGTGGWKTVRLDMECRKTW